MGARYLRVSLQRNRRAAPCLLTVSLESHEVQPIVSMEALPSGVLVAARVRGSEGSDRGFARASDRAYGLAPKTAYVPAPDGVGWTYVRSSRRLVARMIPGSDEVRVGGECRTSRHLEAGDPSGAASTDFLLVSARAARGRCRDTVIVPSFNAFASRPCGSDTGREGARVSSQFGSSVRIGFVASDKV